MAERHVSGDRLSAFLDDELDERGALEVTHHLDGCERCLRELAGLRATRDALRRLPSLQAPVLTARLVRGTRRLHWWARVLRVGVALAVLPIVVLLVAYAVGDEPGGVAPSTDRFLVEHLGRTGGGTLPTLVGDR